MVTESRNFSKPVTSAQLSRNLWGGILFGLGIVAFIDEVVFHQLLHWHHFYDKSTTDMGLVSDGLFHAFSFFATIGSSFMFGDLLRKNGFIASRWIGGILIGGGTFQLYDGIIQHKMMRIHQIRYNVQILPYDLVWNIIALIMIIVGWILVSKSRSRMKQKGE